MTTHQASPLSRANAEEILTGTASEPSELGRMIAAARGPADSGELAGEATAMIRYQAARLEPAAAPNPTVRKRMSDKLLAAKLGIAAAALAAAATGGAALAATAHTQTEPAHHAAPATTRVAAPSHDGTPTPEATEATAPPPSHAATVSAARPTPPSGAASHPSASHPSASPAPALRGLCIAYLAMGSADGKVIDNPAFRALVTAAGGKGNVTAYCQTLIRADPYPTGPASSYPLGPPVSRPGETPSGHRGSGPPDVPPGGPQADQP
jgi:hypothetical protein